MNLEKARELLEGYNNSSGVTTHQYATILEFLDSIYKDKHYITHPDEIEEQKAFEIGELSQDKLMVIFNMILDVYVSNQSTVIAMLEGIPGLQKQTEDIHRNFVNAVEKSDILREAIKQFCEKNKTMED